MNSPYWFSVTVQMIPEPGHNISSFGRRYYVVFYILSWILKGVQRSLHHSLLSFVHNISTSESALDVFFSSSGDLNSKIITYKEREYGDCYIYSTEAISTIQS